VENVLKNNIIKEIVENAKKTLRKMKSNQNMDFVAPNGKST